MSAAVVVGVYGKVESQADFLRSNAGEFSQAGMDRWFQEALRLWQLGDADAIPFLQDQLVGPGPAEPGVGGGVGGNPVPFSLFVREVELGPVVVGDPDEAGGNVRGPA